MRLGKEGVFLVVFCYDIGILLTTVVYDLSITKNSTKVN